MIEPSLLEQEFPQDQDLVYLNHAAVSPWPRRSTEAIEKFARENSTSGAEHYRSWSARETLLREQLRKLINAPALEDIALLKNTSEAISVVASGMRWQAGDKVVSTNEEFPSNRFPWEAQREHGVSLVQVPVQVSEPEQALIAACDSATRIMSISSVQYASGLRLDLEKLGHYCRAHGILFCVDAIQSIGAHSFDVQAMQADFAMADAHKWMLGPEGIALFYCRAEIRAQLKLHQYGWHMVEHAGDYDRKDWQPARSAKRFECGTPNTLGIFALSASLSLFDEIGMPQIESRILKNTAKLMQDLEKIRGLELVTSRDQGRHAGIVSFRIAGADQRHLHTELMRNRVICAHRSGAIRFSPHYYTPENKLDRAIDILTSLI